MRTVLTRIFSAFLASATTLSVVAAPQVMKKAGGIQRSSVTALAAPERARVVNVGKGGHNATPRNARINATSGLRQALTTVKGISKRPRTYAAASDMPALVGSLMYSDNQEMAEGIYSIPTSSDMSFGLLVEGTAGNFGGVIVNGVYYAHNQTNFLGMFYLYSVVGYDMETGEQVAYYSADVSDMCPGGLTLDPTTGTVYAIHYGDGGTGRYLATVDYGANDVVFNDIASLDGNWNAIACAPDGTLYGISYTGEMAGEAFLVTESSLCKLDKNTGAVTTVGQTGMAPQYISSATIDPKSGRMFWNVCAPDETGNLCEVDLSTGKASVIYDFPGNEEIGGMAVLLPLAEDGAPGKVSDLSANFNGGSLSGTIDFTAPTTLFNGENGAGALTYTVLCDGVEVASGSTSFGASVSAQVSIASAGAYTFAVYCSNSVGDGPKARIEKFVGNGIPAKTTVTAEYLDGTMNVAWTPVSTSADGGYIDPAEVTYTVTRYPDNIVVKQDLKTTTFSESIAEPDDFVSYQYGVKASYAGASSAEALSNSIALGSITPPYTQDFADPSSLGGFTIIDGNGDGKVWTWDDGTARMAYNTSLDMDDWLITPPVKLTAGNIYKVRFSAAAKGTSYPERIEVKYGNAASVAGMTQTLLEPTVINSTEPAEFEAMLEPEADGTFYIGFHGISDADSWNLYIHEIEIAAGLSTQVPAAASDLVVTPGANGALTAHIAFTVPDKDVAGNDIYSYTTLQILRDGDVIKSYGAWDTFCGEDETFDDVLPAEGTYTYSVVMGNQYGEGLPATATVYVGTDYPGGIQSVSIAETANTGEVTVSWPAVTTDANGAPLEASKIKYNLYDSDGELITTLDGSTTSYTYNAVPSGQDFVQVIVFAETSRGMGEGNYSDMIAVGTPYDGMDETFVDGSLSYIFGLTSVPGAAGKVSWSLATNANFTDVQTADNGYIYSSGDYLDYGGRLFTGKISLASMTAPAVTFYTYNIAGDDANTIAVGVRELGQTDFAYVMQPTAISAIKAEEGWIKVTVDLSAYKGKIVQICFDTMVKQYKITMLDNIKVASLLDNNLVATDITAPAKAAAGADYNVNVTVANEGVKDASGYTVDLYANGGKIASKAGETLTSGAVATVEFECSFSEIADEPVTYKAVVVYAPDEDLTNNETAEITVTPIISKLPAVKDLAAQVAATGVNLTWTEPDLTAAAPEAITEDFEDATSFAHEYGDWTFVDADNAAVGGFQDAQTGATIEIPGITVGETKAAFFVFDDTHDGFTGTSYQAHSGHKYLASLFPASGNITSDDWAISPELYGGEQTISFFAKSYSSQYAEQIEVYYSTGSLDINDFVAIPGSKVFPLPQAWTQYSCTLPEGAKYFAIRSYGQNAFMLLIDDVTFIPAGAAADLSIIGYNIFRNGEKINTVPVAECSYADAQGAKGDKYVVTVVYTTGISAASNEATAAESGLDAITAGISITTAQGAIIIAGAEGVDVTVVAADGKVLHSAQGDARVAVLPGVYVVKAGHKIAKVLVK